MMRTTVPAPTTLTRASTSRRVPLDKRKRTETSCDKCKSRKQKCRKEPGQEGCRYCLNHGIECLTTQPRKKRLYGSVEGLGNRLALLESLVKGLLPEADVTNMDEMRRLVGIVLPAVAVAEGEVGGGGERRREQEGDHTNESEGESGDTGQGETDDSMALLPDQQGQVQYIGPASSFAFHVKLRTLVGRSAIREFVLFGRNAADPEPLEAETPAISMDMSMSMKMNLKMPMPMLMSNSTAHGHTSTATATATAPLATTTPAAMTATKTAVAAAAAAATSSSSSNSKSDSKSNSNDSNSNNTTPNEGIELLVAAFFEHINPDFPVLHEASFREALEGWQANPATADASWVCSFLCVLLLARRVARVSFAQDQELEQERLWWRRVQSLLPVVIFTSSVLAVQALLLAAMHLHNTNHRDACWNITGAACRIAFAIGLHQDKVSTLQTPLARELRKRLWWTLYAFEQMQLSSYDRPSAIAHPAFKTGCPNERIIGMAGSPPDYARSFNCLVVHLAAACRAPKTITSSQSEEAYVNPLSPAAGVLRDLARWNDSMPSHLRIEALHTSPPAFHRPLLLLHALYHYTITVLCRGALYARASILFKKHTDSTNAALIAMAESCTSSGRELGRIMLKLDAMGKFDAVTWWDVWYALASGWMLVLDLVCLKQLGGTDLSEPHLLLSQLVDLAQRHRRNPYMPGTIEKWASIISELPSMADAMKSSSSLSSSNPSKGPNKESSRPAFMPPQQEPPFQQHQEAMPYPYQSPTTSGAYMFADNIAGRFYPEQDYMGEAPMNAPFDRNTQMQFMDFTMHSMHDWNWGDLGSLLGNGGVPNT